MADMYRDGVKRDKTKILDDKPPDLQANYYTLDEAIENIGFGRFQVFIILMGGFALLALSMELTVMSIIGPVLECDGNWYITQYQGSAMTVITVTGLGISAPLTGYAADKCGRRKTLLFTSFLASAFSLMSSAVPNVIWFCVMRFLVAVFLASYMQITTYVAEFLPKSYRGKGLAVLFLFLALGTATEIGLTIAVLVPFGWRWWILVSAVPILIFSICLVWLPDSPHYELNRNYEEKVVEILDKMASRNRTSKLQGHIINTSKPETETNCMAIYIWMPDYRVVSALLICAWFSADFANSGSDLMYTQMTSLANNSLCISKSYHHEPITSTELPFELSTIDSFEAASTEGTNDTMEGVSTSAPSVTIEVASTEVNLDTMEGASTIAAVDTIEETSTEATIETIEEVSTNATIDKTEQQQQQQERQQMERALTEATNDTMAVALTEATIDSVALTEAAIDNMQVALTEATIDSTEVASTNGAVDSIDQTSTEGTNDTMEGVSTNATIDDEEVVSTEATIATTKAAKHVCHIPVIEEYKELLWLSLAKLPGIVLTFFLIDSAFLGRKGTACFNFLAVAIIMLILLTCMAASPMTALLFCARAFSSGAYATVIIYTLEVYPTRVRGLAIGCGQVVGSLGTIISPYVAETLIEYAYDEPLYIFAAVCLIAALAIFLMPYETRGKNIAELSVSNYCECIMGIRKSNTGDYIELR